MRHEARLSIAISIFWLFCAFPLSGRFDDEFGNTLKDQFFSYFFVSVPVFMFWGWRWVFQTFFSRELLWGSGGLALWGAVVIGRDLFYLPVVMFFVLLALTFSQEKSQIEAKPILQRTSLLFGSGFIVMIFIQAYDSLPRRDRDTVVVVDSVASHSLEPCENLRLWDGGAIGVGTVRSSHKTDEAIPEFSSLMSEINSMTKAQRNVMCKRTVNTFVRGFFWANEVESDSDTQKYWVSGRLKLVEGSPINQSFLVDREAALRIKTGGAIEVIGILQEWVFHGTYGSKLYPILSEIFPVSIEQFSERDTYIGTVSVFRRASEMDSQVMIDYEPISELRAPIISVSKKGFWYGRGSPILFFLSDGGTACAGEFRFLRKMDGKIEVSEPFGTCSDKPEFIKNPMNPHEIIVDLPSKNGNKRFTYSDGKMSRI